MFGFERMKRWLLALSAPILMGGCGDSSPTSGPAPVTPSASPTATPAPAPTPLPGLACNLGPGVANASCSRDTPTHLNELDNAINLLIQQRPDIFNLNVQKGGGSFLIRSQGQFYLGIMRNLEAKGLCSFFNGDEFQIKNSNDLDDAFDIVTGDSYIRRGAASYRGTCYPASFPLAPPPPRFPAGDCALGTSRELACQREVSIYLGDVEAALDQLVREQPQLFNTNVVARGTTNWYQILDGDRYIEEFRKIMKARGFCSVNDGGEEIVIKKSNTLSESYDIFASDGFIRRGESAYRGTCYPAYF